MNKLPAKLGRYHIVREIGRGAMGVVYRAHDPIIEREVAIKAIHLAFQVTSEEKQVYLNRFFREAKAAGKLNHPNIVTIYDVDEDKETGIPFIVMEYLEGTTLQEIIADGILLPLEDVNNIMIQIASALNYAHKQGVVHRDVKSANILILEGMKAKITDFGIARLSSSDLTKSGQFIGTPNYMSPEQIDGKILADGRSDLFSLGVIFYLLLTGERPFSGDSFTSISYKIVHTDPIPPKKMNPGIPEVYNTILSKLMAKDPAERYQTGADLIADLERISEKQSLVPPPDIVPAEDFTVPTVPDGSAEPEEVSASLITDPGNVAAIPFQDRVGTRNLTIVGGLVLVALAFGAGALFYSRKSPPPVAPPPIALPVETAQPEKPSLQVQSKVDLGINYYKNGFYEKSIEELKEVLLLDPENIMAKKYLEDAQRKKATSAKRNNLLAKASPKSQTKSPPPLIEKPPAVVITNTPKMNAPRLDARVFFEFEHPFPSGTFSIYLKDRLLYQGKLSAKKERLLLFPTFKGRLSGEFGAPAGEVELRLQAVSTEAGISATRKISAKLEKGKNRSLVIKFIQISKQLDTKWS